MYFLETYGTANTLGEVRKMRIEFLVEDISGERLLTEIMEKYIAEMPLFPIDYSILSYKGIGGLSKGLGTANVKAQQLLNDLPKRMKALQAKYWGIEDVSIFIVLDNDAHETTMFKAQLEEVVKREGISMDHVFCIAIEEMEAWLMGDREAIQKAYKGVADRIASKHSGYMQDSICGTWEYLADMLTKGGISKFRKKNPTAYDVGRCKSEWAENIGRQMNIRNNVSPSFQEFIEELDKRRTICFYS